MAHWRRTRHHREMTVAMLVVIVAVGVGGIWWTQAADPDTTVLASTRVGNGAMAVALDARVGHVFVADQDSHDIAMLDATSGQLIRTISLGNDPTALASLNLPFAPSLLAVDARHDTLYVASPASPAVIVLDALTGRVRQVIHAPGLPVSIAVAPALGRVLGVGEAFSDRTRPVIFRSMATVYATGGALIHRAVFDPQGTIGGSYQDGGVAVDERTGLTFIGTLSANGMSNAVHVLDVRTGALLRTVTVGSRIHPPTAAAVDERTGRVFVAMGTANSVGVLDARSGAVLRSIPVGPSPMALAVDARLGHVFVVNYGPADASRSPLGNGNVSMLDATSGRVLGTVAVGEAPRAVAVDQRDGRVFVLNGGHSDGAERVIDPGSVSVLDARTGRVVRTVRVGDLPVAVAVDEQRGRAFVATYGHVVEADRWAWLPGWLRGRLPCVPPPPVRASAPSSSVSIIDATR